MDETDTADDALDRLLARSAPALTPGVITAATSLPARLRASMRRHRRWVVAGVLASVLTFGGTAAIAAPLLLQPFPGYTKLVAFSYGVQPGRPGIRCQTIIAIKPTPSDPRYDADVVTRFSDYMRRQRFSVPVPVAAREPYTGHGDSTSPELYRWPGTDALNRSYAAVMDGVLARFHQTDPEERRYGNLDPDDPLSHSVMTQASVSCAGHP